MYARPTVDGAPVTFGVSGMLWRDSLIMYDRATRSLWSQVLGRAVAGPREGDDLREVPSEQTTWGSWKRRHPDTLVLERPAGLAGTHYAGYHRDPDRIGVLGTENPDDRLPGKALVYGVEAAGRAAAVPFAALADRPVLNTDLLGRPAVVFAPPGEDTALVYERTVGEEVLTFERAPRDGGDGFTVRDAAGRVWDWQTGRCTSGECPGEALSRIPGTAVYWGVWAQFHPDTAVVGAAGR